MDEKTKRQVLIITYYWPPSGGPGVQRWLKFAKYLPEFNIQPIILTVDPKDAVYPVIDETLEEDISPGLQVYRTKSKNKVYDWYKRITKSKTVPYSGFANESNPGLLKKTARFIRGNFFLPDGRRGWIKYAYREACRLIEKYEPDILITTGPPHSTHLTGLKLKKKFGIKWIADFRDPWSNIQYKAFLYQTRLAQNIDLKYERRVLEYCDVLLLAVDERTRLEKIHPHIEVKKMLFLPNGYDENDFKDKHSVQPVDFVISYTGTLAENYPTGGLLRALVRIKDIVPLRVRFIGRVDDHVQSAFRTKLGDQAEFTGFVPHSASIDYLMSSSVLLLINARVEESQFLLHGKIFEYLASGKQILLLGAPEGIAAQIIQKANAGAAFDYDDSEGIKDFLLRQYQYQSEHTIPVPDMNYISQFSRKALTGKLAEIMEY